MGYLLAALLGGFLAFNSFATPQKAARMAQDALQKAYPGSTARVQIEGKRGSNVLKGKFRLVRVEMSDVTLAALPFSPSQGAKKIGRAEKIELQLVNAKFLGLPIARANFDFQDVEYDFDALRKRSQFQIVRSGPAQMRLQLGAPALQTLFAERLGDIENLTIAFQNDRLLLTGQRDVLGFKTPIELTARPVGAGNAVRLENVVIKVGGVALPAAAASALLKDLNPVYTFDREGNWPFNVEVQSVTAQNNALNLTANLSLKTAP